ncbi:GNAT family N-acetyltransferase [Neolewinella litorea]|uniref:N-acetyltransferase n=1 Tax=Neolewinella litorea TaxID=2562452 RepID=A0A4S4NWK0_9BACT|nr:GNAT family N-acetyltransferase [Neolewinella litorea]THH40650.1 N-acetyltransferase [Neolewinella litorea]
MEILTDRLRLRKWTNRDKPAFAAIQADPRVMEYFPATLTRKESDAVVERFKKHHKEHGFGYFAAERRTDKQLLGFIGLSRQEYPAFFTPCVDIGWMLHPDVWGQGLAAEGARACLEHAFGALGLDAVRAVTVHRNMPSIRVMHQLGMAYEGAFIHPDFADRHDQQPCLVYVRRAPAEGQP